MSLVALYAVYTCQKSLNFINAFVCWKQKCKLAPFNLAHQAVYFTQISIHRLQ